MKLKKVGLEEDDSYSNFSFGDSDEYDLVNTLREFEKEQCSRNLHQLNQDSSVSSVEEDEDQISESIFANSQLRMTLSSKRTKDKS